MLSRSMTQTLPDVDDWLLLPLPASISVSRRNSSRLRVRARFLYWEIGKGLLRNLRPEDAAKCRADIADSYKRYRAKAIIEGRTPINHVHYQRVWRWTTLGHYRREKLATVRGRLEAT